MSDVMIFWDPMGQELDSLKEKKIVDIVDGDTTKISVNIRMLSIDTPETDYEGKPSNKNEKLVE